MVNERDAFYSNLKLQLEDTTDFPSRVHVQIYCPY